MLSGGKYLIYFIVIGLAVLIYSAVFLEGPRPDGSYIFEREGCIGCHSYNGMGGSVGPDLTGVTNRRSDTWIREQLMNPRSHDPHSGMPYFGHLSENEVNALIRYLDQ